MTHASSHPAGCPPRVILVVDDDSGFREAMDTMLRFLGFSALCAASGEEALTLVAEGVCPWLVLLDIEMPGLGGVATLALLRRLQGELPIVLCTGLVTREVRALAADHARVGLLPKPFGFLDLKAMLAAPEPWRHRPSQALLAPGSS